MAPPMPSNDTVGVQTFAPVSGMMNCVSGGDYVTYADYAALLSELDEVRRERDQWEKRAGDFDKNLGKAVVRAHSAESERDALREELHEAKQRAKYYAEERDKKDWELYNALKGKV